MGQSLITGENNLTFVGGFNADCVSVLLGDDATALDGMLAQQVQVQVSKQPRQLYEIGTSNHYTIDGRTSGSGTIAHMIGPNVPQFFEKIRKFASVCEPTAIQLLSNGMCTDASGAKSGKGGLRFTDGVLNSIQASVTANDFVISSQLGFMFFDVESV